jgi:cell division protein FtsQ
MALLRKHNRRMSRGPRFELPQLVWPRGGRAAGALLAVAAVVVLLKFGLDQPVRSIVIDGSFQRVSTVEVEQAARGVLSGGFVSADLEALRTAVEALAWVDRARVQRLWPDRIRIEVVEQQAAARWGEDGLLNTRGDLFATGVRHVPPELPRLDGPDGTEWQVAQRFLAIQQRLDEEGLRISALRLDPRGAWEFGLSNGVNVRLGRRQVDERIERFMLVGAKVIAGRAADIDYVDMRYSNGFSVGWRKNRKPRSTTPAALADRVTGDSQFDG